MTLKPVNTNSAPEIEDKLVSQKFYSMCTISGQYNLSQRHANQKIVKSIGTLDGISLPCLALSSP